MQLRGAGVIAHLFTLIGQLRQCLTTLLPEPLPLFLDPTLELGCVAQKEAVEERSRVQGDGAFAIARGERFSERDDVTVERAGTQS